MAGAYTHETRAPGTILTASIYNADHNNHIDNVVHRGGGVDIFMSGTISQRPSAGVNNRWYLAHDEPRLYRDDGTAWNTVFNTAAGLDLSKDGGNVPQLDDAGNTWPAKQNFADLTIGGKTPGLEEDVDDLIEALRGNVAAQMAKAKTVAIVTGSATSAGDDEISVNWGWIPGNIRTSGLANGVVDLAVDHHGYIYIADSANSVRKLYADGSEVWEFSSHTSQVNAVAVDTDGNVYTGAEDNTVRCIDPDGTELWQFDNTTPVNALAVDDDLNVYIGDDNNRVRSLKYNDFDEAVDVNWTFTGFSNPVLHVIADRNGPVVAADNDITIKSIAYDTGSQNWTYDLEPDVATDKISAIALDGEFVYMGIDNGDIRCLAQSDGSLQWDLDATSGEITGIAVDFEQKIYATVSGNIMSIIHTVNSGSSSDPVEVYSSFGAGHAGAITAMAIYPGLIGAGFWRV